MYHAGLVEGTVCACGPALAAVTVRTSWAARQVDLDVCAKGRDEEGQRRRASRGVFQPRGEKNTRREKHRDENLNSPNPLKSERRVARGEPAGKNETRRVPRAGDSDQRGRDGLPAP